MKKPKFAPLLLGLALVWMGACDQGIDRKQTGGGVSPEGELLAGMATFGHEVRAFRPCGSVETLWAIDSSGALWDLHQEFSTGQDPYEEVFAVVLGTINPPPDDGFGADYEGSLVVREILYSAGEGFGCESEWSGFSYKAYGNEPFWDLKISPERLELNRLGLEPLSWKREGRASLSDPPTFSQENREGVAIRVDILPEPCRDSMSGAYHALTAMVRIEGQSLSGCALKGLKGAL